MPILYRNPSKKRMLVFQRDRCGGCSYCIEVCPEDFLRKSSRVNERVAWPPEPVDGKVCTMCDHCTWICPDFSIYTVELPKEEVKAAAPATAPAKAPGYPGYPAPAYPGAPRAPSPPPGVKQSRV